MQKKKAKNKTEKIFRSGEVMVLLEKIRDDFRAFGDGQKLLTDKVDKMDARLSSVEDKFGMNSLRLITIENEIRTLKRDNKDSFKSLAEYLYRIEQEIQSIKRETATLKTAVSKKADKEKLADFEKRLLKTEKLVLAKIAG